MLYPHLLENGNEQWEVYSRKGKTFIQYDYRDNNGKLFSCVRPSLEACRTYKNSVIKEN